MLKVACSFVKQQNIADSGNMRASFKQAAGTTMESSPESIATLKRGARSTYSSDSTDVLSNLEDRLVEQRRADLIESGERLTILCCGEAGTGKTTLIHALFGQQIKQERRSPTKTLVESSKDLSFRSTTVKIRLTTVDTPGFGDSLDIGGSFDVITNHITNSFDRALAAEKSGPLEEPGGVDAVLYFIGAHRIKALDLAFMRRVAPLASIIPIICKADTYTREELQDFRVTIINRLHSEGISTVSPPFAVICASNNETFRHYPWGNAESENPDVSDLPALRRFLLTEGLLDLHKSRRMHYEQYRQDKILAEKKAQPTIPGRLFKLGRRCVGLFAQSALMVGATVFTLRHIECNDQSEEVEEEPKKKGWF